MRIMFENVNLYFFHDTLTPLNVRVAVYNQDNGTGLVPEEGDLLRDFPGWDGDQGMPITVRVDRVTQISAGLSIAFDVHVSTVGN